MFNFFKRSNNKEVSVSDGKLPVRVDMHSHILPGIDDGSPDIETSLLLLKGLYDLGIETCIATPHIIGDIYRNTNDTIEPALAKLQLACEAASIPVKLSAAAEYMLDDYFMELLHSGQPLRTVHKNLLLTELPYTAQPANLQEMLFHIITAGYQPILAHPERYFYFHANPEEYQWLKELGFVLQVNLLSLTGYYGKNVAKAAKYILQAGLAGLVGTDLHHSRHLAALQSGTNQQLFRKYVQESMLMNNLLGD